MHHTRTTPVVFAAIAALMFVGCGKDDKTATKPAPETVAPEVKEPAPPPETQKPVEAPDADYVWVWASHAEPKPGDPIKVAFETFTVTKAQFDPANLEGATAELEIDLGSLSSGLAKRDGHLKTADYLDVGVHPKAVVVVSDVKKKDDKTYAASAEVSLHGVTKTMPVEFQVVGGDDSSVKIKATHAFSRADFSIGQAEGDSSAPELKLEMQLTLIKS